MSDYVPVNERIESFVKSYPEGSIQSEIVELTSSRVTVKAYAYRTPEDPRPGVGHSSLEIPGSTPYTKGSEIENAETSAWGRAIAALGFEVKRGIASHEEVRNKTPQPSSARTPAAASPVAEGVPPHASAPDDPYVDAPPMFDTDPTVEDVLRVSGGELAPPVELQERIARAEAKGQQTAAKVCPEHGAAKVKTNKRGLYCATKVGEGWCDWSAAA